MNFHELSTNPAGKGSAQIANRGRVIIDLKDRANIKAKNNGIEINVYKDGEVYIIFFRLSSEHWRDLWYDTVIQLTPPQDEDGKNNLDRTISNYDVKFASNMPSFAFTYLYTAAKKGVFLESFKSKFPDIFFNEAPKVRNPSMQMGYEKAIMLPAYYMTLKKLHYKDALDKLSKGKPNMLILMKKFMPFLKKMEDYKEKMKAHKEAQKRAGIKLRKGGGFVRYGANKAKSANKARESLKKAAKKSAKQPKRAM